MNPTKRTEQEVYLDQARAWMRAALYDSNDTATQIRYLDNARNHLLKIAALNDVERIAVEKGLNSKDKL